MGLSTLPVRPGMPLGAGARGALARGSRSCGVGNSGAVSLASPPELLVLHAVRIQGMTDIGRIRRRFGLTAELVDELLQDDEARGWVQRVAFRDHAGWSLTPSGRVEDERRVAAELDASGGRAELERAHRDFAPLNAAFLTAMTNWQLRPAPGDRLAQNDHSDWRWDERVLDTLAGLQRRVRPVTDRASAVLERFEGYPERLAAALEQVDRGRRDHVDGVGIDSCHVVWFELHEDLLATLGIDRSAAC